MVPVSPCVMRPRLPVCRRLSPYVLTWQRAEWGRKLSVSLLIKALILSQEFHPCDLIVSQGPASLHHPTGVRISTYQFRGSTMWQIRRYDGTSESAVLVAARAEDRVTRDRHTPPPPCISLSPACSYFPCQSSSYHHLKGPCLLFHHCIPSCHFP